MQRAIDSILVFCGMCSFAVLKNFPLGCLFVFIILVKQILEYRKERSKENGLAVCLYALGLLLVLTVTYFELSK